MADTKSGPEHWEMHPERGGGVHVLNRETGEQFSAVDEDEALATIAQYDEGNAPETPPEEVIPETPDHDEETAL